MKKYADKTVLQVTEIICNRCGKVIPVNNGLTAEDALSVKKEWGYFSNKDGTIHSFDLCEDCYDKWIQEFLIPVEEETVQELI